MPKFKIEQTCPAQAWWTFEVEAESEEAAIAKIKDGEVESTGYEVVVFDGEVDYFAIPLIETDGKGI